MTNLIGLIMVAILAGCFYYRASKKNGTSPRPTAYPAYRANTKMLIPFVLYSERRAPRGDHRPCTKHTGIANAAASAHRAKATQLAQ